MKTTKLLILFGIILMVLSCKQNLPKEYGIYIQEGNNYQLIHPQKTFDRGTIVESIKGIKGSSGVSTKAMNCIIVYEHEIEPNTITLSKLSYINHKSFRGIIGNALEKVELYVPTEQISINIEPVKNETDMYRINLKIPLDDGFYAIHFGSLTNESSPFSAKQMYDFIIGTDVENYCSIEEKRIKEAKLAAISDSIMTIKTEELLAKINQYYNNKSFSEIRNIQRKTDGSYFNNQEWAEFQNGLENWFSIAGKVNNSKILNKQITKNIGNFFLQTDYQKAGTIKEKLRTIKLGDEYYITFLGQ